MIDWLQAHLGMNPELQTRLLTTLATIVGLWIVHRVVLAVVYRRVHDPRVRYRGRKTLTYVPDAAGVVIDGRMWVAGMRDLTTNHGFISARSAMSLNDRRSKPASCPVR